MDPKRNHSNSPHITNRGPSQKNSSCAPRQVGKGIFDFSVTLELEVIGEVAKYKEDNTTDSDAEMFVTAKITLGGVITVNRERDISE